MNELLVTLVVVNIAIIVASIANVYFSWGKLKDILMSDPLEAVVSVSEMNGTTDPKQNFNVQYEYSINGMQYKGKVDHRMMANHQGYVERHPVGSCLNVYVSNSRPDFSMVQKPTTFEILLKIIAPYLAVLGVLNAFTAAYVRSNRF